MGIESQNPVIETKKTEYPEREVLPQIYTLKEAFRLLGIGNTSGREWVALYEHYTKPLPRESDKPNATRLVTQKILEDLQKARALVIAHPKVITAEEALRRTLGIEDTELKRKLEYTPEMFQDALTVAMNPLMERISSLESEVQRLRLELQEARALPPVKEAPRANTFLSWLKNVFARGK
jgi:uncharacterized small protein (DUF1192 family)